MIDADWDISQGDKGTSYQAKIVGENLASTYDGGGKITIFNPDGTKIVDEEAVTVAEDMIYKLVSNDREEQKE